MRTPDEERAEEALAEASANVAIGMVRDAVDAYDRSEMPVATVLATIATAGRCAAQSMMRGWPFLELLRGDR